MRRVQVGVSELVEHHRGIGSLAEIPRVIVVEQEKRADMMVAYEFNLPASSHAGLVDGHAVV